MTLRNRIKINFQAGLLRAWPVSMSEARQICNVIQDGFTGDLAAEMARIDNLRGNQWHRLVSEAFNELQRGY
jgi:hypothetical protein